MAPSTLVWQCQSIDGAVPQNSSTVEASPQQANLC